MEENKVIEEAVAELQGADEAKLKEVIEKWFESTRNDGMRIGAQFISAAVVGVMQKHLKKGKDTSLRDYKRMTDDIWKIVSVQLKQNETQQNDLEDDDDGTTEEIS
jgi:hypothetical protein